MTAYNISTLADLQAMDSDADHLAGTYTLLNNIDASDSLTMDSGSGFRPIGTLAVPFTGTFDGGGFAISNLYINRATTDYVGLFGKCLLADGFIKDLSILNATIIGNSRVGILSGNITGVTGQLFDVSDVVVSGTINSDAQDIGGLVGVCSKCTFVDCIASTTITLVNTLYVIGGFCGTTTESTFTTCASNGTISISGTGSSGGVCGGFIGGGTTSTFTSCTSTVGLADSATLAAGTEALGGFCGGISITNAFSRCSATGFVICSGAVEDGSSVGGFAGACTTTGNTFSQCGATGLVENTASPDAGAAGGFIGTIGVSSGSSSITECFARGDVCSEGVVYTNMPIGGFAGSIGANVTVTVCYSTGYVFPGAVSGGFAGLSSQTNATCYWDTQTSGRLTSGGTTPANGKTTAQMKTAATFTPAGTSANQWDFTNDWELRAAVQVGITASNLTVYLSKTGDYENFEAGTKDADSFQLTIPSTNEIKWIASLEALVIGTSGDEWKIASNKLGTPLSPTNFGVKKQSSHGSANIQAVQINEVILFVDYVKRKIREMTYDSGSDKFTCPDLTSLAEHITKGQVKWVAYQRNPDSILWVGLETGEVRAFVYDREQNVLAWSKIPMAGDGSVQSGCVIPGPTEDVIYLVVNRTVAGDTIYYGSEVVVYEGETVVDLIGDRVYLEKFTPREFSAITDCFYVDCGATFATPGDTVETDVYYSDQPVVYDSVQVVWLEFSATEPVSTITGFDHLNGETVKALGDGVVLDDAVVENGGFTAKVGGVETAVSTAVAGLPYTSTVKPMRIILGDSIGKTTKVNQLVISFVNTGFARYGKTEDELFDIDFTDARWTNSCEITGLFTGEVVVETVGGFDPLNPVYIISDSPLPCTVRAIIVDLDRVS